MTTTPKSELATPAASRAAHPKGPTVFRVQDNTGRGPFKPGVSHRWLDDNDKPLPPTFFEEFGWGLVGLMDPKLAHGCALENLDQVHRWFSASEMRRLKLLGYRLVRLDVDIVLAASENQLVVGRRKPFRQGVCPVPWPLDDGPLEAQAQPSQAPLSEQEI